MGGDGWTIDELARQATTVLAEAGVFPLNRRGTAAPDRRVIRWYATIGLLDPPLRTRGRTARYGERHLLQLVAVKRRQAAGRSLTEIQAELAGATNRTLREVAGLPDDPAPAVHPGPAPDDPDPARPEPDRHRFWAQPPAAGTEPPPPPPGTADSAAAAPVYPVPLHPGATLVLSAPPTAGDLAAVHAAARPLLDALADRGLLTRPTPEESS